MFLSPLKQNNMRYPFFSAYWAERRKSWLIPIAMTFLLLQLLFLGNLSYLYGSLFKAGSRAHNMNVLAVDYDGASIGQSLSAAYSSAKGSGFPTLDYRSASEYPDQASLRHAVCKGDYWAAIYTHAGATDRLVSAVEGDNSTAYNPNDTITYITNGIHYPVVTTSYLVTNLQQLIISASRIIYSVAGQDLLASANLTNPDALSALFNPIMPTAIDIMPTEQTPRVLLNTVTTVMPILMQFFFFMATDNISDHNGVYTKLRTWDVYIFRLVLTKLYTLMSGLITTAYIWSFREHWGIGTGKFFEMWMCFWLYCEINSLVLNTLLTTVIPMPFVPFFMLTWIIMNITSTVYPFVLNAGFYRWGYALPAHNIWTVLVGIWSDGCALKKDVALPILFSWWVLGHITHAWATRRRCSMAEQAAEQDAKQTIPDNELISRPASRETENAATETEGTDNEAMNKRRENAQA